jgi:hypothetical protein
LGVVDREKEVEEDPLGDLEKEMVGEVLLEKDGEEVPEPEPPLGCPCPLWPALFARPLVVVMEGEGESEGVEGIFIVSNTFTSFLLML